MPIPQIPGYRPDLEDRDFLAAGTAGNFSAPGTFTAPAKIDFRSILTVENQSNMSSCVGHGGSTAMEHLQYLAARTKLQFSRMFAYITAQRQSGIRGDNGATITGCVNALTAIGCCLEATLRYPARYNTTISQAAIAEAAKYRILGHRKLRGYKEVLEWLQSGKGPVIAGFTWRQTFSRTQGIIRRTDVRGPSVGGHCTLYTGYQGDLGSDGQLLLDNINSWDRDFGQEGWSQWEAGAIDDLSNERYTELIGITDITGFDETRLYNFTDIV